MKRLWIVLTLLSTSLLADAESRMHVERVVVIYEGASTSMGHEGRQKVRDLLARARTVCLRDGASAVVDVVEWLHAVPESSRDGTPRTYDVAAALATLSGKKLEIRQWGAAWKSDIRNRHHVQIELACRPKPKI
ncbi:hypothetical protein [Caenimonas aquaedulcis]|uniref:Uncharacterized protein n=1 Tax=Caenimonas aquaedulcis TaxID=2793270 RepID=A0A931H845_9BURK|nr:hypothetical protein [Caenimonas aquaedulcis]MBG9390098.1 hypothetical protein [Caenimonas aquaedulcis]